MRLIPRITNPIARKRLQRFRQRRRAWVSFWLLLALFGLSLASELLCNERPLYVRFEGRSYFPVFRYYPEDVFARNGRQTRPDYRALRTTPAFRATPGNRMIFAPVPFGPLESIDPQSLQPTERVEVTLAPETRVGSVNIGPDFRVEQSRECGHFFGVDDESVAGRDVREHWELPPAIREAAARRFRNEAGPAVSAVLARADGVRALVSLSEYQTRETPPATVRLTFREPEDAGAEPATVAFDRQMKSLGAVPDAWRRLAPADRNRLHRLASAAFDEPVYPLQVDIGARQYKAEFRKNDVRWPHPPVRGHWLGIDSAGRDVLARILYGLRISMTFGFLLVAASMVIGMAIGAVQGYYGGWVDITGQRLIEIWSAVPFLYVMMLMGSVYGRSFTLLLVCYGLFNWIGISYYLRAEFLRLRGQPFVDAARCMGIPAARIMTRHILPNALTPVITFFPFYLVGAIGSLAALDYLGFGLPSPTPSWGELMYQAQQVRWAWWLILYPSLALFVVMLLGVFVGEGVRDACDPRPFSRME